ncbi:MAG: hypothetical protein WAO61_07395 [Solirubrobacterales bacterium]
MPALTRRELLPAAAGAMLLALVMHWPLPWYLGSHVERDLGDPIVQAWQVAWGGHALLSQPLDFFQANMFWPLPDSLAFSDALAGYAPAGLVGRGVQAAIVRYNLLFLFAYALAFFGAYLLARELGLRPAAAAVAGAAFAYAPWRLEQDGHLHVLSSGGIPLALFLLLRGYRGGRPGIVFAGWAVAAWQVSLGFTLGLQLGYLLLALGAIWAVAMWRRGALVRSPRELSARARRMAAVTAAGGLIVLTTGLLLSLPYQRVLDAHPEGRRTAAQLSGLSGPVAQFAAAPEENLVWGEATRSVRDNRLTSVPEQTLFPGLAILSLAVAGLFGSQLSRRLRIGLGVAVLVLAVLSLGFHTTGAGRFYPYRLLYEIAPGWQGIRVPGRLNTLTSLGLALLAAAGSQWLAARIAARVAPFGARGGGIAPTVLCAAALALVCVEGSGFQPLPPGGGLLAGPSNPRAPLEPSGQRGVPDPQLHLPITVAANRRYVFWSTEGFPRIVNGRGSIDPQFFSSLTRDVRGFPDRRSVARLRELGVRSVILHPYLAPGTAWAGAAARSPAGLGVKRTTRPGVVVFDLR